MQRYWAQHCMSALIASLAAFTADQLNRNDNLVHGVLDHWETSLADAEEVSVSVTLVQLSCQT